MKEIIGFIKTYYGEVDKAILLSCTIFIAFFIWVNYHYHLEYRLFNRSSLPYADFVGHFLIYFVAFLVPWLLFSYRYIKNIINNPYFVACLLAAPLMFACKVGMNTFIDIADGHEWNRYWNSILYWPIRMIILVIMLGACKLLFDKGQGFYGLSAKKFNLFPYFLMLLIMLPLIAAASTQPDFLSSYPKMKTILPLPDGADSGWFYKLLFQLSYGSDFFSVEIFFRGFLIIGLMKWAGKDVILPMACFYCTIHFGKPLGECISSYFGGILLGIISYNTKSIYGGLIVHLGIAWLMEAGGYFGNLLK